MGSIAHKKIDPDDDGLVRLRLDSATDRGEYSGDGTGAAVTTYAGGREYTVTDNPGGTPVPEQAVDDVIAAAAARGYRVVKAAKTK